MPRDAEPIVLSIVTDADVPALARLGALAFASDVEGMSTWLRAAGLEELRAVREGGEGGTPVASLLRIPMGQHFGGRSVPMVGIAGVSVGPESRGRGLARSMMSACIREMHGAGVALSTLYCSTQALYRQSGYEQAGYRYCTRLPVSRIGGGVKARRVRPVTPDDDEQLKTCYARYAARFNGTLDRGAYIWNRIREWRGVKYNGFAVLNEAGRIGGYLFMTQQRDPVRGRHDVVLQDLAFESEDAGRQLLGFLADFEPTAEDVVFFGAPLHPITTLLAQQRFTVTYKDVWMLRVVHVQRALEARGYPRAVNAAIGLELTDETIPEQSGTWTLTVREGRGEVKRGAAAGLPTLRCGTRGLAAIYSGLYSPSQAALLGLCSGDDAALDLVGAAFAGGTPWMTDFF